MTVLAKLQSSILIFQPSSPCFLSTKSIVWHLFVFFSGKYIFFLSVRSRWLLGWTRTTARYHHGWQTNHWKYPRSCHPVSSFLLLSVFTHNSGRLFISLRSILLSYESCIFVRVGFFAGGFLKYVCYFEQWFWFYEYFIKCAGQHIFQGTVCKYALPIYYSSY